ncbi:LytTR family DNA-binding domain-containing protein [uncultured Tenacibaculum sp.]|uniref:LytR/AlgR family response regulator transcription factor n=1 Tax=uncultured Tenacibaculum sp. TaxID=174713 RepID=UPI00261AEA9B|nr:LytTR family DNA-binding domain-containing protein [uncultured Tenacibaculum sp.]
MKVIIIEDELVASRRLERMLSSYKFEIQANLVSVKQSVSWLKANKHPDLIFLDVHLSDGLCFDIFKEINIQSKIIFTTAFSEYSIKAFEYNSIFYLLKPIKEKELQLAINKADTIQKIENEYKTLKNLFLDVEEKKFKTSFTIKIGKKIKIINQEEIIGFYSEDNVTYIKSIQTKGIIHNSLTHLEEELNPKKFFRVNRSWIVHKDFISDISIHKIARLKLVLHFFTDQEIIVSRERVKDFKNWID